MSARLKAFWDGPALVQRLSELDGMCRTMHASIEALARDAQRAAQAQAQLDGRLASLHSTLERLNADVGRLNADVERIDSDIERIDGDIKRIDGDIKRIDGDIERTNSDIERIDGDIERTNGDVERLRIDHAALNRVAVSLPAFAAVVEDVRSLRAGQMALQGQIRTTADQEPLAAAAVAPLRQQLEALTGEVGRLSRFVLKTADDRVPAATVATGPPPCLDHALPLDAQFAQLDAMVPRTFRLWMDLLDYNRESYSGFPVHSCSVKGHPSAAMFTYFVNQFLRGYVLDIGCGPQPVPLYLQEYPPDHVYGVDPISTAQQHPFHFYQGVAEFLPWSAASFDIAIAATSLDHVLFLDKALREIHRVLKDDGEFLVWVAFVAGSAPYEPCAPDIEPVDEYHLFHFTEEFFEGTLGGLFVVKDKLRVNLEIDHHFYRLGKLPPKADDARTAIIDEPQTANAPPGNGLSASHS